MDLVVNRKVAVVFDFDRTLSPVYMQRAIFEHFDVDEKAFWASNKKRVQTLRDGGWRAIVEFQYLNQILDYVENGTFFGLNNALLTKLGRQIPLYPGVEECFGALAAQGVEIYIVSSGLKAMLGELPCLRYVRRVYGSEFLDAIVEGKPRLQRILRAVTPSDKIEILEEISKGSNEGDFDTCTKVPDSVRRIPYQYMLYVGDGLSDSWAFDLVKRNGGYTLGVYDPEESLPFQQLLRLNKDGLLDSVVAADYKGSGAAGSWIHQITTFLLDKLRKQEENEEKNKNRYLEYLRGQSMNYTLNNCIISDGTLS